VVFFRAADQAIYIQTESYPGAFVPCLDLFYATYLVMLYTHLSYKSDLVAVWNHSVPCYPDLVHLNIDRSKKILVCIRSFRARDPSFGTQCLFLFCKKISIFNRNKKYLCAKKGPLLVATVSPLGPVNVWTGPVCMLAYTIVFQETKE
jgi:hypothetical protein